MYRSRLVAQQIKYNSKEEDIFAATPPLEAQKLLVSLAVQKEFDSRGERKRRD